MALVYYNEFIDEIFLIESTEWAMLAWILSTKNGDWQYIGKL